MNDCKVQFIIRKEDKKPEIVNVSYPKLNKYGILKKDDYGNLLFEPMDLRYDRMIVLGMENDLFLNLKFPNEIATNFSFGLKHQI